MAWHKVLVACVGLTAASVVWAAEGFDWDRWAAVVNEDPCGWLDSDTLAALGIPGPGEKALSRESTRCTWSNEDGTPLFVASVVSMDAAEVTSERREELAQMARPKTVFERVGGEGRTAVAIQRTDRLEVRIFAHSDTEAALVYLQGIKVRGDSDEVKAVKRARLVGFTEALVAKYGL
ncbi:MAG: hypothetical protein EP330_09650 [Deltaproteobacteria bacterium]|nr:MAG: hypothetical protein EP330_09650 [Deltaproteobacteria bacterium]